MVTTKNKPTSRSKTKSRPTSRWRRRRNRLDHGATVVYSCPTCRRPLFPSNSQDPTSSIPVQGSNNNGLLEQVNLGLDQQRVSGRALPVELFPNQQHNPSDAVWRGVGLETSWAPPWPNPGMDGAGTSGSIRSVGLSGVQLMMRQLASVREGYAGGSPDSAAAWNLWPTHQAPASSSVPTPSSSSLRFNRNAAGLRFRNTSPPVNESTPEMLDMLDRVRGVLPHIPDEVIIEDLRRTNNINITVNNLLLVQ